MRNSMICISLALALSAGTIGAAARDRETSQAARPSRLPPGEQTAACPRRTRQASPAKELVFDLGEGVKLELVLIPAGEFLMGSPDADRQAENNEKPQHRVRITKPFYMGKYKVMQDQWEADHGQATPAPFAVRSTRSTA